ncbi:tripartite tricarboxylate transporter TctB family protein [Ruegeria arenilitoris]|uniref:tripartite tricarboxylate transporter TctB family protein n=1 Tax=Ruegeria arenilitoris TaxID=1173585 RepID=UPI00147E2F58|nr:tripartite tricarboxylate transporter TctB family protein [Ruegeria arenilitoris]
MDNSELLKVKTKTSGQVVFVVAGLAISLLLLSQIGNQTEWSENARNIGGQPRLWPAIALVIMVFGFAAHYWLMRRRRPNALDWVEARRWVEPLEYLLWFLIYVAVVPRFGFMPMSILFACTLTYRLGYRSRAALGLAAAFGIATVVLFKGLLGVNIPGAQVYEYLPDSIRTFFLVYL